MYYSHNTPQPELRLIVIKIFLHELSIIAIKIILHELSIINLTGIWVLEIVGLTFPCCQRFRIAVRFGNVARQPVRTAIRVLAAI